VQTYDASGTNACVYDPNSAAAPLASSKVGIDLRVFSSMSLVDPDRFVASCIAAVWAAQVTNLTKLTHLPSPRTRVSKSVHSLGRNPGE